MNRQSLVALAAFFVAFTAQAAEPPVTAAKPVPPAPIAAPAASQKAAAPQKTAALSQQDKMRECNKQATGRKGDERKAFMKTCLSKKKA